MDRAWPAYRDAVVIGAFKAALQYSTHFRTSWTGSEPSGIAYSNSTDAGIFHLFLRTSWRISLIGVSPVPHGRFSPQCSGVVRSFRWKLDVRAWCLFRKSIWLPPLLPPAVQWPRSTLAMLPFEMANASSKQVMLPCRCVWYAA